MNMSTVDAEFAHIRRTQDARFPHEIAVIMPGQFFVCSEPMIVYTVLGSCVSVCIRDTLLGIGGMNHFMLPEPQGEDRHDSWGESTRYGSYAMESLINGVLTRGGHRSRLEIKVFGGGRIFEGKIDVGARNVAWALHYLQEEGLNITSRDVGEVYPRKVYYFTDSGRVLLKKLMKVTNSTISDREAEYRRSLRQQETQTTDITLF